MSKNDIATPILLKKDNKYYILMTVLLAQDGSIYFNFPSKEDRRLSKYSKRNYENVNYKESFVYLKPMTDIVREPKVSFHPRDMILHVNTNQSCNKVENYKVYNSIDLQNKLITYFLQVVFTRDISFYKEYNIKRHSDNIVIVDSNLKDNEILSLEFILHSADLDNDKIYLPYSKNRNLKHSFRFMGTNSNYSYTVFISTLINNHDNGNILINLNSTETNCIYTIDKIINEESN